MVSDFPEHPSSPGSSRGIAEHSWTPEPLLDLSPRTAGVTAPDPHGNAADIIGLTPQSRKVRIGAAVK